MMKTRYLLAATAASALMAAGPAYAQILPSSGSVDTSFSSDIESNFDTDISFEKDVTLRGVVGLDGEIDSSSAATAANNAQQQMDTLDPEAGGVETVQGTTISGSGNIGVNVAAGFWNDQINSAAMAVSNNIGVADAGESAGGWSDATTTSLQTLNNIAEDVNEVGDEDTSGANNLAGATISGTGNIGVNEAAGLFNEQANLLTLAVATNSVLAEAQAGVVQLASNSGIGDQTNANTVAPGVIGGASSSGNIGVNLAAGFGNQQANALTVATSSGAGSSATPPTTGVTPGT